ncbi:MAG: adenylosuccinate synthase [Candidatus Marinimicrobia bacterium]|nr:adenylosuccinate synthase [Candidatus Neomarinimicrobiota bacterium]
MSVTIVIGAQWGDEGKGKIVDILAEKADVVIRYQGGANAGHTVIHDHETYILHAIPSGIISGNAVNIIGGGCVVDPLLLKEEIKILQEKGITVDSAHFKIADNAHLVTPIHKWLDKLQNAHLGTTQRGIGPAYEDKVRRTGIRFDMIANDSYKRMVDSHVNEAKKRVISLYGQNYPSEMDEELCRCFDAAKELLPYIAESAPILEEAVNSGKEVLFEGAQGTMLDIDHGTYPYVTSSNTTIGGAYTGSGVFVNFDRRIGVVKSYTTRVGEGPFPTELLDKNGEKLRDKGREFGSTTGRPRRCGWLDIPLLKKAIRINGFNALALTKISCLSGFDTLKVAVNYNNNVPVYKEFKGWHEPIEGITDWKLIPEACKTYIHFIEKELNIPINMISTGPHRANIIFRNS